MNTWRWERDGRTWRTTSAICHDSLMSLATHSAILFSRAVVGHVPVMMTHTCETTPTRKGKTKKKMHFIVACYEERSRKTQRKVFLARASQVIRQLVISSLVYAVIYCILTLQSSTSSVPDSGCSLGGRLKDSQKVLVSTLAPEAAALRKPFSHIWICF